MLKEIDILDRGKLSLDQLLSDRIVLEDALFDSKEAEQFDGELLVNGEKFYFEVLPNPSVSKLNKHLSNRKLRRGNYMLIFDFASEEVSDYCIKNSLNYLDSAGNAYINSDKLIVYIEGRQDSKYKESTKRIFQKTGLKLIFELIQHPDLLNQPYRVISEYVGVSTASVGNLIEELETNNFLLDVGGRKKLNHVERLIMKWVFSYTEVLKPKLHRGYFKLIDEKYFEKIVENSRQDKLYFSGEYGAFLINNEKYIKPSSVIIYTDKRLSYLAKKYKLVPVNKAHLSDTRVELIEPFWNTNSESFTENSADNDDANKIPLIASDIIVYADLLDSDNSRNIEIADKIFKNEIRDRLLKRFV